MLVRTAELSVGYSTWWWLSMEIKLLSKLAKDPYREMCKTIGDILIKAIKLYLH